MPKESLPCLPGKPIKNETLTFLIHKALTRSGQKRAITFLRNGHIETELLFGQLDHGSDCLARSFLEMGVRKGDRVVIFLPKCVHWVVAYVALQKIGAIVVPLNPGFKMEEIEYFLGKTSPKLAVVGIEQERMIKKAAPNLTCWRVNPQEPYQIPSTLEASNSPAFDRMALDDPALIIFTSGTTGRPKGAILTQRNLSHDAQNVIGIWEISDRDVFCHALPLFHVHGLCFGFHTSLVAGATMIMLDSFDPAIVLGVLAQKETTMFMAVPTMYSRMIERHPDSDVDYSHLRLLTSGSAPLAEKDFARIEQTFGTEPVEREGMSETLMNFSNPLHGKRRPGSIGLPLPYLEVRIVNPNGFNDVQPGQVGELWLKSPAITPGYWEDVEETKRAFSDGWFRTGDLGRQGEDGYFYLTDRIKNIIITGGENVSPKEVEMVLNSHPDIQESCVVGIPDESWGEVVVAGAVVKHGSQLTPERIRAYCKERVLDWKCPRKVLVVSELPKNQMGKVLREKVKGFFI